MKIELSRSYNASVHAAKSPTNSLESETNDLRSEIPKIGILSDDTIFDHTKYNLKLTLFTAQL
jgi:hypothetical protein